MTSLYRVTLALFSFSVSAGISGPLSTELEKFQLENYAWTETVSDAGAAKNPPMIIKGKADPSGFTSMSVDLGSRQIQGYLYENKAYVTCAQRNWRSEPLLRKDETPGEFMARLVRGVTPPAREIDLILKNSDQLKKDGDIVSGALPSGLASKLLDQDPKRPSKTKRKNPGGTGSVKIWTKEGTVTKYEIKLHGKVDIEGKETEIERMRTIEITNVGATSVTLPDQARKKFGLDQRL